MLLSGQELKCWSQSRSWKISNLFHRGSVGLEGKMNDERMISQTPIVHKLDMLPSWCLADCSKYMRESQWRRVNVLSHLGWSFLLLGNEERESVLYHVVWSVLLRASEEVRREGKKWLAWPFMVTQAEWHQSFSLGEIYKFELQRLKQFPHKIIIWNSFCYNNNKMANILLSYSMNKFWIGYMLSSFIYISNLRDHFARSHITFLYKVLYITTEITEMFFIVLFSCTALHVLV